MNNKRIDFKKFQMEYNSSLNKETYIESHINRTYCPIAEKKVVLDTMCEKAKSKTIYDVNYMDQLLLKINFDLAVIILYTDIDVHDDEFGPMSIYDYFKENKIINTIYGIVGEEEITELLMVQQYIVDAFNDVENSLQEIIRSNLDRYADVAKTFMQTFSPDVLKTILEDSNTNG